MDFGNQVKGLIENIANDLNNKVFNRIYDYLEEHPEKRNTLNPAFPYPKKIRIAVLKQYLVVEYCGPENPLSPQFETEGYYYPNFSILDFIGVDFENTNVFALPEKQPAENISFFLGESASYLCDYFYDFTQLPFELIVMNGICNFESSDNNPTYISNTSFFWTNNDGKLMIKHIDFMEIIPFLDDGIGYHTEESFTNMADFLIKHEVPQYKIELHRALNELIELLSIEDTGEVEITSFLGRNPEIMQYAFGINKLNPQVPLEWQYKTDKHNLKPDFMPERMDGYCDIFEFKLPHLKSKSEVGTKERQQPSYEIDAAISQLNCYDEWCSQKVNTDWLETTRSIKVLNPQRYLIMGHSQDFTSEQRRRLREQRSVTIFTYDEFIELARYQIYRYR